MTSFFYYNIYILRNSNGNGDKSTYLPHADVFWGIVALICVSKSFNKPSERRQQLQVQRFLQEVAVGQLKLVSHRERASKHIVSADQQVQTRQRDLAMQRCQKTSPFIAWHENRICRLSKSEWRVVVVVKSARASALERSSRGQKSDRLRRR